MNQNKDDKKKYDKEYYQQHRERILTRNKEYYKENRERELQRKKEHYEANKEQILIKHKEHGAKYREKNRGVIKRKARTISNFLKRKIYSKGYRERNKDRIKESRKHEKKQSPEVLRAKARVRYALKTGKLQRRACCYCGSEDTVAHHPDYSQPLKVVWLCRSHHMRHHSYIRMLKQSQTRK